MPTDESVTQQPEQRTGDLLVVFGDLTFCLNAAYDGTRHSTWHLRDLNRAMAAQTFCHQNAGMDSTIPTRFMTQVCAGCRAELARGQHEQSHILLREVSAPALPITGERAAGRVLWSATASCDDCGGLLSVEGTDPETLGLAILAAKTLIDQHRDKHHSTTREQHMELLWPDSATPAIATHLRGIIVQAGEETETADEQEEGPSITFTPVSPICDHCGVDLSQSRTTHKSDCPLFDPENAARLAEWAAEDAATEDE